MITLKSGCLNPLWNPSTTLVEMEGLGIVQHILSPRALQPCVELT